jgi:hypothetical protein
MIPTMAPIKFLGATAGHQKATAVNAEKEYLFYPATRLPIHPQLCDNTGFASKGPKPCQFFLLLPPVGESGVLL